MNSLSEKIKTGNATIGVIGIGKRGLPLAANCANSGFITLGFDSRPIRAEMINGMNNYIKGYSVKNYRELWYQEVLHGTTDFGSAASRDIVLICADDHIAESYFGDITPESCIAAISTYLKRGTAVVYLSNNEKQISQKKMEAIIVEKTKYRPGDDFICAVGNVDSRGTVVLHDINLISPLMDFFVKTNEECI